MTVRFKDGTVKTCTSPTEQMLFREGTEIGWLLSFSITEEGTTSDVIETVLRKENIGSLTFIGSDSSEPLEINGYDTVISAIIRYDSPNYISRADIQLSKRTAEENYQNGGAENG